jgi:hypothetical protein
VKSIRMTEEVFRSRLWRVGECLIYQPPKSQPHAHTQVRWRMTRYQPYQLVWILAHGAIPKGKDVLRTCGNVRCCRLAHLRLTTPAQTRAVAHSRRSRKLSLEQVEIVRRLPRNCAGSWGLMVDLAEEWGVAASTLRTLRTPSSRAKRWRGRKSA